MSSHLEWQTVYDFWFPKDLSTADASRQWQMLEWWMRGGANAELPQVAPLVQAPPSGPLEHRLRTSPRALPLADRPRSAPFVQAARSGHLEHWLDTPRGRLSLVIVLDQFPRGLFAGTPKAYSSDPDTLRIVEEGFRNGHYDALTSLWERFFYFLPLAHVEGPDHL